MNISRIGLLVALGLATGGAPVLAQGAKPPMGNAQARDMMAKKLGLTKAQLAKIEAIRKDIAAQVQTLQNNKSLSSEQRQSRMMTVFKSGSAKVNAVFTPGQRQKIAQMRAAYAAKGGGR